MNLGLVLAVIVSTTPVGGLDESNSTVIILGQEVRIVDFDSQGVPLSFATPTYIGINKEFLDLPKFVQEFLIAHELGHIYLGHLDQEPEMERNLYPYIWNTVSPFERDADLFASELVGIETTVQALLYCKQVCFTVGALSCFVEASVRVKIVEEQYCF